MRNLFIAIVCAAALSGCSGQRVVAGDADAASAANAGAEPVYSNTTASGTAADRTTGTTTTSSKPESTPRTLPASMGRPVEVK
jgi:hypothetical protein